MVEPVHWLAKNLAITKYNKGRYCAPNPSRTNCRPSGVSDPIKLSTSWFVVLADGLRV